jgi:hypothetical protein
MGERLRALALPGAAIAIALVAQLPALRSGFVADDYVYLRAAKAMPLGGYARLSFTPFADDSMLAFGEAFYRPLYFLGFWPLERLFGDRTWAYHLVLLALHIVTIVLTALLARRLSRSNLAAGLSALAVAVHPVPFETVSWISSMNVAAVPLGLGALLLYFEAIDARDVRRRWLLLGVSATLALLSLGFRETSVVFLFAIGLWQVSAVAPLWDRHAWPRLWWLAPYAAVAFVYLLLRTEAFTGPWAAEGQVLASRPQFFRQSLDMIEMGLVPISDAKEAWAKWLVRPAPIVFAALLAGGLLTRRWAVAFCLVAFVATALVFAASPIVMAPRYLYFGLPLLAIALAMLASELMLALTRRLPARAALGGVMAVTAFAVAVLGLEQRNRVVEWRRDYPDVHQAWVDELRAEYDSVPSDTLCVSGTPLLLALFDAVVLEPTVNYYYPGVTNVIQYDPARPGGDCRGQPTFDYRRDLARARGRD